MLTFYDSEWMYAELKVLHDSAIPVDQREARARALSPDFRQRGAIRSAFDGRYRFSRYFSMLNLNQPETLNALLASNDIELYDLHDDPGEMRNLALDRKRHAGLFAMNAKLNRLIAEKVGFDSIDSLLIRDGKIRMRFQKRT
ncbi:hypothetical protein P9250_31115 [Caballeronia sp. LP006]|uniref:hypothetical protein n=1 Tax=Caballeronia sp. LP006 TaxID=3038552 RepID=UPI00285F28C9|nr:hypothetical protein [Caballeronia sp. LP006]MDR5832312.1 hypothetical protein [Caballeronia sp. LP006]